MLHKLTIIFILVLNWFYADTHTHTHTHTNTHTHIHTHTHTCMMSTNLLLHFSFHYLLICLLVRWRVGCKRLWCHVWCGIMYRYTYTEHWRPKWVKSCTAKRDRTVQASYAKLSSGANPSLPPVPCALFRIKQHTCTHYSAQGLSARHCAGYRGV